MDRGRRDKLNKATREWYAKNLKQARAGVKDWASRNKDYRAWNNSRRVAKVRGHQGISMSLDEFRKWYAAHLKSANGFCEWCNDPFGSRGPIVDHDHGTGEVRGMICHACNSIEGHARSPEHLERIAKILRAHEAKQKS